MNRRIIKPVKILSRFHRKYKFRSRIVKFIAGKKQELKSGLVEKRGAQAKHRMHDLVYVTR